MTFCSLVLIMLAATLQSSTQKDEVMTKENGTFVVNTTTLGKSVLGYASPTPVKIYIKKNKVEKVEFLKNQETPKYFARIKKLLLTKWEGMKVSKAQKTDVDGVTGATLSSDAVKENVKRGLNYYKKH